MCTVSYIPLSENIIITSNRDEQHGRPPAMVPAVYSLSTGKLLFPKDVHAGGTWFAVHENRQAIVLLNGAKERHESSGPYRMSRGLVLLDMVDHPAPMERFSEINLDRIEPFTAIVWSDTKLFECRWDGSGKESRQMDSTIPHIWSSATLYDEKASAKRRQWFSQWLGENPAPSQDDVLDFHHYNGHGDHHDGILMNRNGLVYTVSVSSIQLSASTAIFKYLDVQNHRSYLQEMSLSKTIAAKR